jgi:hypothetical protein
VRIFFKWAIASRSAQRILFGVYDFVNYSFWFCFYNLDFFVIFFFYKKKIIVGFYDVALNEKSKESAALVI